MNTVSEATPSIAITPQAIKAPAMTSPVQTSKVSSKKPKKRVQIALEDIERPVVSAEAHLLDADESGLLDELLDLRSIRCQYLVPYYKLYLRIFRESIEDFQADPANGENEIAFWRSDIGHLFGESLCELTRLMFDREINIHSMRRAAEAKMGLPHKTLEPSCQDLLAQEQRACEISEKFRQITQLYGHLPDPESDAFFEVSRRKKARR